MSKADKIRKQLYEFGWHLLDAQNRHLGKTWKVQRAIEKLEKEKEILKVPLEDLKVELRGFLEA